MIMIPSSAHPDTPDFLSILHSSSLKGLSAPHFSCNYSFHRACTLRALLMWLSCSDRLRPLFAEFEGMGETQTAADGLSGRSRRIAVAVSTSQEEFKRPSSKTKKILPDADSNPQHTDSAGPKSSHHSFPIPTLYARGLSRYWKERKETSAMKT